MENAEREIEGENSMLRDGKGILIDLNLFTLGDGAHCTVLPAEINCPYPFLLFPPHARRSCVFLVGLACSFDHASGPDDSKYVSTEGGEHVSGRKHGCIGEVKGRSWIGCCRKDLSWRRGWGWWRRVGLSAPFLVGCVCGCIFRQDAAVVLKRLRADWGLPGLKVKGAMW